MGTKNKPGTFDCLTHAEPDEPYFLLLARDPVAPVLVRLWVELRRAIDKKEEDAAQRAEALDCRNSMLEWMEKNRPHKLDQIRTVENGLRAFHMTEAIDLLVGECAKLAKQ